MLFILSSFFFFFFFFFNDTATTEIYTLSLHDALPIWLDRQRVAELTGTTCYAGGMLDRRAGTLQPLAYVRGLASAAKAAGAAIHGRSAATGLEAQAGSWRVVTSAGTVTASTVILATNAYTDDLWPGLRRTVLPVQSYQVATRPLPDNVRRRVLPGG